MLRSSLGSLKDLYWIDSEPFHGSFWDIFGILSRIFMRPFKGSSWDNFSWKRKRSWSSNPMDPGILSRFFWNTKTKESTLAGGGCCKVGGRVEWTVGVSIPSRVMKEDPRWQRGGWTSSTRNVHLSTTTLSFMNIIVINYVVFILSSPSSPSSSPLRLLLFRRLCLLRRVTEPPLIKHWNSWTVLASTGVDRRQRASMGVDQLETGTKRPSLRRAEAVNHWNSGDEIKWNCSLGPDDISLLEMSRMQSISISTQVNRYFKSIL